MWWGGTRRGVWGMLSRVERIMIGGNNVYIGVDNGTEELRV